MNKKDILELRRRLKKDACTITRIAGCYVDINKKKVVTLNENFLNLPDEEFYKYLELAKKTMSGNIGNNILELEFTPDEEYGGKQQFFMGLRESALKNDELLNTFYDIIIEGYESDSNYLILVFHDSYDIMTRTTDNQKLDESEEVYEYLLTAICPVELSKAGLSYRQEDNRIGARIRDFVVGAPSIGFLFPAFSEGGADIHKMDYFLKDAKNSNQSFIEEVMGCGPKRTATEKRKAFAAVVKQALPLGEEEAKSVMCDIEESIMLRTSPELSDEPLTAPIMLDEKVLESVLNENDIEESVVSKIKEVVMDEFAGEELELATLVDEKSLAKNLKEKETKELHKEISSLKKKLQETDEDAPVSEASDIDVVLKVKPDKEALIKSQMIDNQKYILIPIEDNEQLKVNGVKKEL